MTPRDVGRCTLTQILAMLDRSDPDDPHAGQVEVRSAADLDALWEEMMDS